MSSDNIYMDKNKLSDFTFDNTVSEVFDDMVSRSVPFYNEAQLLVSDFLENHIPSDCNVYDLGCATATTLVLLAEKLKICRLIGIDSSKSMLDQAQKKISEQDISTIDLIHSDIMLFDHFENAGCHILNLTLQFLRPIKRPILLSRLYNSLVDKGILVLFEKVIDENPQLNRTYIDMYYDFKRSKNYTDLEISRKREELENVLIPFTMTENIQMLQDVGFNKVSVLFKYLNFGIIIAIKTNEGR